MINQRQQKLTPTEEQALVDYVRRQTRAGYPLSVEALRQMANVLLERHLKPGPTFAVPKIVGHNWVQKFYQRHPEVKAVNIRAMDALRVRGANIGRLTVRTHGKRLATMSRDLAATGAPGKPHRASRAIGSYVAVATAARGSDVAIAENGRRLPPLWKSLMTHNSVPLFGYMLAIGRETLS